MSCMKVLVSEVLQPVFVAGRTSLTAYLSWTSEALTRKTWTRRPLQAQRACWRTNQAGWIPKVSIKVVSAFFILHLSLHTAR